jgi:hypothetical protein
MPHDQMVTIDEYGLPGGILGDHPDEFYAVVGRIVCLCAVLEDKVTSLRHVLARAEQGRFAHQPVSEQIRTTRALARLLPDPGAETVVRFLDRAETAVTTRNALVHSSFPAQPSGTLWGHRPARDRSLTDGSADTFETSIDDLRHLIAELAELIHVFNHIMSVCSPQP